MKSALFPPLPIRAMRRDASQLRKTTSLVALGIIALLTLGLSSPAQAQYYNEQVIHSFNTAGSSTGDGYYPYSTLVTVNGILYGTTSYGGTDGVGTIFSYNPSTNTETVLYSFTGNGSNGAGSYPEVGLTYDSGTGKLFGTTYQGGSANLGSLFSFDLSSHALMPLYSFKGQAHSNPAYPAASLTDVNGTLFGTTSTGGANNEGTVFSLNATTLAFTAIHSFANGTDGYHPYSDLTYDSVSGKLYGTTSGGGTGDGVIFSVDPTTNAFNPVSGFTGTNGDGYVPDGGMMAVNGKLYGTTKYGGANSDGTLFSFNPATSTETPLYSFTGTGNDGENPQGDLIYDSTSGKLVGTTNAGGTFGFGTVFSFDPSTHSETPLYSFNPAYGTGDGKNPVVGLLDVNGTLYGTTGNSEGSTSYGVLYALTPVTLTTPVAKNDGLTIKYNTARTAPYPGVLGNDNAGGSNQPTATLITNVSHGTVTLNSDGSFAYTPNNGYSGPDSFTYQIANQEFTGSTATVTLTVVPAAPVAKNDGATIKYNQARTFAAPGVLGNDSTGGTATTAALVSTVTHGSLTLHSDGSFIYTPATGYLGSDSFTYKDTNSVGTSNVATVTLSVVAVVPTANNDGLTIKHNQARTAVAPGVLGNDSTGGSPTTAAVVTNPTHGTVTLNSDGSFTYTPNTGYSGTDTFTYKDTNAVGTSNTATVTLTVQ